MQNKKIIYGGGCTEVEMANVSDAAAGASFTPLTLLRARLWDELATKTPGKKALALASFAEALRQIPAILAMNAGYDSAEIVAQLKAIHKEEVGSVLRCQRTTLMRIHSTGKEVVWGQHGRGSRRGHEGAGHH